MIGLIAESLEVVGELLVTHRSVDRRTGDLVAVDMENRKYGARLRWIEELVAVPRSSEWAALSLTVADDTGDDQFGIVEDGSEGSGERVSKFATLKDCARSPRIRMTRKSARPTEHLDEMCRALFIELELGIVVMKRALGEEIGDDGRRSMARSSDKHHVEMMSLDEIIEMCVDEVESRNRSPVSKNSILDIILLELISKKTVLLEIELGRAEVVRIAQVEI
jgi:hypothetical protein